MVAVAIALMIIGLALIFVMPWVGIPLGLLAALLFLAYVVGFGRRTATRGGP
jgi:hypothetical protein